MAYEKPADELGEVEVYYERSYFFGFFRKVIEAKGVYTAVRKAMLMVQGKEV